MFWLMTNLFSMWMFTIAVLALVAGSQATFTYNCMKCIREVEGGQEGVCNPDAGSTACGPYQIHYPYWLDCYQPGGGWQACTKYTACSETCVKAYMNRYGTWCTGGRTPTCRDYAMIHNGGPDGCQENLVDYWNKVNNCCQRVGGC